MACYRESYPARMQYYDDEYLAHYGIPGMKWGVRRFEQAKQNHAERKARTAMARANKGPKRFGLFNAANSAARTYYRRERTGNFRTYRKAQSNLDRKEARLTPEQIRSGRYRVARARNIKRKTVSALTGGVVGAALISSGAGFVGAAAGLSVAALTNHASGGTYYSAEARAYGRVHDRYSVKDDQTRAAAEKKIRKN